MSEYRPVMKTRTKPSKEVPAISSNLMFFSPKTKSHICSGSILLMSEYLLTKAIRQGEVFT